MTPATPARGLTAAEIVVVEIVPPLEPHSRWMLRWRGWALVVFLRWDCFAIGVQRLTAGGAVFAGPATVALVRERPFQEDCDRRRALVAEAAGMTGEGK